MTDQEVEDVITLHGLGPAGARQLRASHKVKGRRVLATALNAAILRDKGTGTKKVAKKKATAHRGGPSKAGTDREFKSVTVPSSTTFNGRWTSSVTVSGSRSFVGFRDAQVLRHISVQLFWYIRNQLGRSSEQEVQAMYHNDRILIAANEDESVKKLADDFTNKAKGYLRTVFEGMHQKDERAKGDALKLAGLFAGKRVFSKTPAVDTLIEIASSGAHVVADISSDQGCIDALTQGSSRSKLVLTVGGGELHAEQKLVLALYRARQTGAVIYGKKRPCAACHATLCFANEKLHMNIRHNLHHGGYWATSNPGLLALANLAIKRGALTKKEALEWIHEHVKKVQSYQSQPLLSGTKRSSLKTETVKHGSGKVGDSGYDSASDSEIE